MLNLDVIVVASAELGSINSTVLTTEYLKQSGINIRGIIVNRCKEDDFMQEDNLKQIENLTGIKVISVVKEDEEDLKIENSKLLSIFKEI